MYKTMDEEQIKKAKEKLGEYAENINHALGLVDELGLKQSGSADSPEIRIKKELGMTELACRTCINIEEIGSETNDKKRKKLEEDIQRDIGSISDADDLRLREQLTRRFNEARSAPSIAVPAPTPAEVAGGKEIALAADAEKAVEAAEEKSKLEKSIDEWDAEIQKKGTAETDGGYSNMVSFLGSKGFGNDSKEIAMKSGTSIPELDMFWKSTASGQQHLSAKRAGRE